MFCNVPFGCLLRQRICVATTVVVQELELLLPRIDALTKLAQHHEDVVLKEAAVSPYSDFVFDQPLDACMMM